MNLHCRRSRFHVNSLVSNARSLKRFGLNLLLGAGIAACLPFDARADGHFDASGIYVVDVQRVINDSIIGKAARTNVETELKKREAQLGASRSEYERLKADVEKQKSVLSGAALDAKKELVRKKEIELTREVQDQRQELERKNEREISRVVDEVRQTIKDLADQKQYSFIVEKDVSLVVYADPRLDVTDQVIKMLDSKKLGS